MEEFLWLLGCKSEFLKAVAKTTSWMNRMDVRPPGRLELSILRNKNVKKSAFAALDWSHSGSNVERPSIGTIGAARGLV